jgi:hypothetical protein
MDDYSDRRGEPHSSAKTKSEQAKINHWGKNIVLVFSAGVYHPVFRGLHVGRKAGERQSVQE